MRLALVFWPLLGHPLSAWAEAPGGALVPHGDLITNVGLCIATAAILAVVASKLKQPLILAYLAAGVLIGPEIGLRLIVDQHAIEVIAEVGLMFLLFIIGLEIDLKQLRASGKPVIATGLAQFLLCTGLGLLFYTALGFRVGDDAPFGGPFGVIYMATTTALSSTLIVVKLLYDKFELDTLPGRITLGILVFQDVWAILVLAMQPNFLNPQVAPLVASLAKGILLVVASLLISAYLLPPLLRAIAKVPELMLITALAWCFIVSAAAHLAGLSREMGALIAGMALSTLPYGLDVIAKVGSIRDFFVTLFFVALGMKIPLPSGGLLGLAVLSSLFLMASRFLTIVPILYLMGYGHRVSLLPAINLAQISEFSLVIASLGLALGHIDQQLVALLIFIFVITSTTSTYLIQYSHPLHQQLGRVLTWLGLYDIDVKEARHEAEHGAPRPRRSQRIVFLGFFREASSVLHEFERPTADGGHHPLLDHLLVIDFNPEVHTELRRRGIACLYGDIAHAETLHHAEIHGAELVLSTIPDAILKGTTNARLLEQLRRLCPHAKVLVTADSLRRALDLYQRGADFVFIPRLHSAAFLAYVIETGLRDGFETLRTQEIDHLRQRHEVLP
jgi:Kef-type K+ transport system membrane component KefB